MFTLLVVFTGGCYPALAVVSSNAFGLKLLSCGLTQFELKKLAKIKIFGTIILENVPQLILQLTYASHIGEITDAVRVAFVASLLSVTASTLGYLIDRDDDELKPVEYYLSMQCNRSQDNEEEIERGLEVKTYRFEQDVTSRATVIKSVETGSESFVNRHHLTDAENENILNNRGRTQALSESLAAIFEIQPRNIEIGATLIHKKGTITHVVHMVYKTEIEIMEAELLKDVNEMKKEIVWKYFDG